MYGTTTFNWSILKTRYFITPCNCKYYFNDDVVVTPSYRAVNWSETWLSRGSYGVFVAITGSTWPLRGVHGNLPVL